MDETNKMNQKFQEVIEYINDKRTREGIGDIQAVNDEDYISNVFPDSPTGRVIQVNIENPYAEFSMDSPGVLSLDDLHNMNKKNVPYTGHLYVTQDEFDLGNLLHFEFKGDKITEKKQELTYNQVDRYHDMLEKMNFAKDGIDLAFDIYKS